MCKLLHWQCLPQETTGDYDFNGTFYVTKGVLQKLSHAEIASIYAFTQSLVRENNGIDYLLVFEHNQTKERLFFIDQIDRVSIQSGNYSAQENHCTLLLASEY